MRIAITGANGQLGQALVGALSSQHKIVALARSDVDLASPDATQRIVATGAELVIHPAAYTDVDGCTRDPQRAYRVNCLGTRAVALACAQLDAPLVHVSTNEVFSGAATRPYYEYDQAGPINAYGWSKWCGEQAVRELLRRFFIVRVAWLFGGQRNFVRTVLRLARERGALTMVADEVGSPTYAADVAQAIGALIAQPAYGTYHLVNSGHCSRYEFAQEILRQSGLAHVPLTSMLLADYKRDSMPPPFSPLANEAAAALGIALRPWQEALATCLTTL
ncbi:MAG: dTDP-4-dehydrorhamnose reductase [Chloroflexales bacterium]|nr:dTDP-4-dehydrorhamnose reductase [Chloroflexales bacterium]